MGKKLCVLLLMLVVLLTGCRGWINEPFVSVTPHVQEYVQPDQPVAEVATNYDGLYALLLRLIEDGTTQATVDVSEYTGSLERELQRAITRVRREDPLAAYTVTGITTQTAEVGVRHIVTMKIQYIQNLEIIREMKRVWGPAGVASQVETALKTAESRILLEVNGYQEQELEEVVRAYYMEHLDEVMELPRLTVAVYPDKGNERIMQIDFTYTHDRQTLVAMTDEVQTMLTSAALYIRGQETELARAERLGAFLRPMLTQSGSTTTPVYSLFHDGIADSDSLAHVFWLLCRDNGLSCQVVTGTKDGEDYCWNILMLDGVYCHVDLMESWLVDDLMPRYDEEMERYTWDGENYPACPKPIDPPPTQSSDDDPTEGQTGPEDTQPEETEDATMPEETVPETETGEEQP